MCIFVMEAVPRKIEDVWQAPRLCAYLVSLKKYFLLFTQSYSLRKGETKQQKDVGL